MPVYAELVIDLPEVTVQGDGSMTLAAGLL
ncbi:hypothetical protein HG15A2_06290 [Adhaeretor mobilis]|uniref:Uncharacterized protein n=1 Tax=Adhaeretor mobilis TaxID=1930276 RepID=A0A517MR61_9BACT|nr:hypothetical protein HG15A2_06290 [Adhaeretor mobilis]